MFTGIVTDRGKVVRVGSGDSRDRAALTVEIEAPLTAEKTFIGGSVAVNGVCLTVVSIKGGRLAFQVSGETARRTTLGELGPGSRVNLELPVTPATQLGGHMVNGHVDAVVRVERVVKRPDLVELQVEVPPGLLVYIVEKGSVALDGVSLTAYDVNERGFRVALIPHTLKATTLEDVTPGSRLNLEVDILAKYVAKLVGSRGDEKGGLSRAKLAEAGFIDE